MVPVTRQLESGATVKGSFNGGRSGRADYAVVTYDVEVRQQTDEEREELERKRASKARKFQSIQAVSRGNLDTKRTYR